MDSADVGGDESAERSLIVHVRNLAELHRVGLLTDEEFDARRVEAVNRWGP